MFWSKCRFLFPFILFSNGLMPLFTHSATLTAHFLWEKKVYFSISISSSLVSQPFYVLEGIFFPNSPSSICAHTYSALFTFDMVFLSPFPVDSFIAPSKWISNPVLWVSLRTCASGAGRKALHSPPHPWSHGSSCGTCSDLPLTENDQRSGPASSSLGSQENSRGYTRTQAYLPHVQPIHAHEHQDERALQKGLQLLDLHV